ncbi:unnamed protein product [Caenorhabditis sp. 36 PRJEB53466]|nr:unnamed protein product [Caenorhabditis sp. 36 PRJEB53466]
MSEEFNFTNSLNLLTAFLIITIGLFGVVCNFLVAFVFLKERSEKTAFNLICFFRAISNIIILTLVFIITFFPKTLLGFSPYPPILESWLINISNTLYLGNEYQIVLVALNRFCALFFPMEYSKIFAVPQTAAVLILIYVYRIAKKIYENAPQEAKGCHAIFSVNALAWYYDDSPQCDFVDDALTVILYTFIAMTVLNLITFVKIIMFYKKRGNNSDKETRKRMRKNTIHFAQTMLQDSLYLVDLTFTFKLSSWSNHRLWTYISGTFIWECLHSVDGFIMVMFNERLSYFKKKLTNSSVIPIVPNARQSTISAFTQASNK